MGRRYLALPAGRHLRRAGYRRDWLYLPDGDMAVMEERKIRREKKIQQLTVHKRNW